MSTIALYDAFSADYDRFVDWHERLAYEMPFIGAQLECISARRVMDVACGTGQHAIAMSRLGLNVAAADPSEAMVARAVSNADQAGARIQIIQAGFGEIAQACAPFDQTPFDAITCLGNSIPHILTTEDLESALSDMAQVLRPGGLLLIQQRNFDLVLAQSQRFMPPQSHVQGDREWLFLRFYDYETEGCLAFNVVRMSRHVGEAWQCELGRTRLRPWKAHELLEGLTRVGFGVTTHGNLAGAPFDPQASSDLVVVAIRG